MSDHWFFFSYARTDQVGVYLQQFFDELALEVRRQAALSAELVPDDVGFFDRRGIDVGDDWDETLLEALRSSPTFVCVYTRGYFRSEYCGKEFQVFNQRIQAFTAQLPARSSKPPLIVPVLWDPPERLDKPLPEVTRGIQYTHEDFGEDYAKRGLRLLMARKTSFPGEYERVVDALAWRLVRAGEQYQMGPGPTVRPLADTPSAFYRRPMAGSDASAPQLRAPAPELKGPRAARFVYIAGCLDEMHAVRSTVGAYDSERRYWQPFHPVVDIRVALLATKAAIDSDLVPDELSLQPNLLAELRTAEENNTIVLLIADPWSTYLDQYKDWLLKYDENNFLNCAVLVPWNEHDEETIRHSDELRRKLRQVLSRAYVNGIYPKESCATVEDFRVELAVAINETRRRIMARGQVFNMAGDGNSAMPQVSGPGGDT